MKNIIEKEYNFCPTCRAKLVRKLIDRRRLLACPSPKGSPLGKCGFVFWNNPKPVASIIIAKDGKVLMLQRAKEPFAGYWCLPGGFIDYEELPEEAAVRETKEEIGLDVKIDKLIGVYQIDNDPRGIHLDIIYAGRATSGQARLPAPDGAADGGQEKLGPEHRAFRYFSADNLPKLIAYKHCQAIEDWKKDNNG